jgi:hypothetical protein
VRARLKEGCGELADLGDDQLMSSMFSIVEYQLREKEHSVQGPEQ